MALPMRVHPREAASQAEASPNPMSDAEARMGVQPIDELLAEREALVRKAAPLAARYGSFGTWDARRKEMLALCALKVREEYDGTDRLTDGKVDTLAHAHPDYTAFLIQSETEKARYLMIEDRIQGITERINRGQAVARYLTAELSLTPRNG